MPGLHQPTLRVLRDQVRLYEASNTRAPGESDFAKDDKESAAAAEVAAMAAGAAGPLARQHICANQTPLSRLFRAVELWCPCE